MSYIRTSLHVRRAKGSTFARGLRSTLVLRFPGGREIVLSSARTRRRAVQAGLSSVGGSAVSGGAGVGGDGVVGGGRPPGTSSWP